ncbi:MAG TPA: hypothetical protein VFE15_10595 [Marmoricola sp.]|nr:hypothetical protein [Marmoricola sp.]
MKHLPDGNRGARRLLALAVVLVFAAAVSGCGGNAAKESQKGLQGSAMLAARATAIAFFSLDPSKVASQVDTVLSLATGSFKTEYAAKKAEVISNVGAKQLVVTASVPDGGVALESFRSSTANVLVAVDVSSKQGAAAAASIHYRLRLTVTRTGSRWRTAELEQLNGDVRAGEFQPSGLSVGDDAVVLAATDAITAALSYDYKSLDTGLAAAEALMTPSFALKFRATFATTVRPLAEEKRSSTTAYVRGAGLVRSSAHTARCLVFVDQVLESAGKPSVVGTRVFVDLDEVGGRWLVDDITPF